MKPRILVVDDEQDIRELLKFYLNKEGYVKKHWPFLKMNILI